MSNTDKVVAELMALVDDCSGCHADTSIVEAALVAAFSQPASPVQAEPVAWLVGKKQWVYFDKTRAEDEAKFSGEPAQPLYTHPAPTAQAIDVRVDGLSKGGFRHALEVDGVAMLRDGQLGVVVKLPKQIGEMKCWLHTCKTVESCAENGCSLAASKASQTVEPAITLDFKQATELLAMFGGEPSEITLLTGDGHSGKGLYAHYSDYPEEGAMYLGVPDDEAMPAAPVAQPAAVGAVELDAKRYRWLRSNANTDLKTPYLTIQLSIAERWIDQHDHLLLTDQAIDAAIASKEVTR